MSNPEEPNDDTTRLEQPVQTEATEQLNTSDQTTADEPTHVDTVADTAAWLPAIPERPSGPHAPAIVLGAVCLAVAVIVFAQEVGSLSVNWGDVGPVGIIATGAVLVLFGLVGLLTSRRKAND